MMEITEDRIIDLFKGTNFGGPEKTPTGRRGLMVECILKRAAGYHDGHTITTICKEAWMLSPAGKATRFGLRWAHSQLYKSSSKTILERLEDKENS